MREPRWKKDFPLFMRKVAERLEHGQLLYGNTARLLSRKRLHKEIEDEVLDFLGWGFWLWLKVRNSKKRR